MQRREFLKSACLGMGMAALAPYLKVMKSFAAEAITKLNLPDSEWKKRLTAKQYDILRQEGTEAPFTSDLLNEHREGVFVCAGCDLPLFPSKYKFDSGTGWPSFYDVLPGHIETRSDYKLIAERKEYHCARCGGHHGHIFNDGPAPTGLRHCNNGAVLKFIPKGA